jgi:hypothetical protein
MIGLTTSRSCNVCARNTCSRHRAIKSALQEAIRKEDLPIRHRRISKAEFVGKALKPKSEYILANEVKVLSSSRIG